MEYGPDSFRQDDVPRGTITQYLWTSDFFLTGTSTRDYWVYVPAQYNPDVPTALMVFQDGYHYLNEDGYYRTPIVLDNLIHQQRIPMMIALFINPGHVGPTPVNGGKFNNRSEEYDFLSDYYVRFLIEQLIPEIAKHYNLTDDPQMRAICGQSSGGYAHLLPLGSVPIIFTKL